MKNLRNDTYLYTDGLDAARRSNQVALWRASHQANIACKKAIEEAIRQGFDGMYLKGDCAKEVLEEFGFKRVNWVLANTIQEKSGDGRFCEPNSWEDLDYEGKVLVLSPDTLRESCWTQENQLWYAHDGFGCSPHAIGRSIRCTCLGDGEHTRWNRSDFIGILKEEFLPDWAKERLEQMTGELKQGAPQNGEIHMEV